jgi:hypothetical protein
VFDFKETGFTSADFFVSTWAFESFLHRVLSYREMQIFFIRFNRRSGFETFAWYLFIVCGHCYCSPQQWKKHQHNPYPIVQSNRPINNIFLCFEKHDWSESNVPAQYYPLGAVAVNGWNIIMVVQLA